jgi:hypothetical protein
VNTGRIAALGEKETFGQELDLLVDSSLLSRNLFSQEQFSQKRRHSGPSSNLTLSTDILLRHAVHHKVVGTALEGLASILASTPGIDLSVLRKKAAMEKLLRMNMVRHWIAIIQTLESAGIQVLTIKGPALSIQLYGDPYAREFTDIDILIEKSSVDKTKELLAESGFFMEDDTEIDEFSENPIFQSSHHFVFWKSDSSFRIEVHAAGALGERTAYREAIPDLFNRAERLNWQGLSFGTLSKLDHGVFAIAHGTQHEWCTLHWLLDAAALMKTQENGFHSRLLEGIKANGMEREAKIAALLIRRAFGIDVDQAFLDLDTGFFRPEGIIDHCLGRITSLNPPRFIDTYKKILRYDIPLAQDIGTKVRRFLAPWRIPVADAKRQVLPKQLYFLHFFLRPFNVISRRITAARERRSKGRARFSFLEILSVWMQLVLTDLRLRLIPYEKNKGFIFDTPEPKGRYGNMKTVLSSYDMLEIERLKKLVARVAAFRFGFNLSCLRRSIVLRSRLARAGIESHLVFGAQRQNVGSAFAGHAWLKIGDMEIDTYGDPKPMNVFTDASGKAGR